jgi:peptidoglycan/LPS O-acetylase OafA/YrhL
MILNRSGIHRGRDDNIDHAIKPMKLAYRSDIDGLRAVAVLLVVFYHNFPASVHGGFIGVDVFFVISGFLITSIVCQALSEDKFSFLDFYRRRINRIFPALLVVLTACTIAGWFLLFPVDYRDAGKAIGFGAAFLSNIALLYDTGYFAAPAQLNPLLHLWSLGVEEQFYLLWPPLIVLVWRWKRGPILAAAAILLISFVANIVLTFDYPLAAFYLPLTRFWELMIGCALAIASARGLGRGVPASPVLKRIYDANPRREHVIRETCAWLGLFLVGCGVVFIDSNRAFPGYWALLPALATGLLIFAGPAPWVTRQFLGHRALVHIGLISYPLYLWHWPLLTAIRLVRLGDDPPPLMKVIAISAAFALAEATWRFAEKPFRHGGASWAKTGAAFAAVAAVGFAGVGIYAANGMPGRFDARVQTVVHDYAAEAAVTWRANRCILTDSTFAKECDDETPAGMPRVVLWGDSHAAMLYPGLREIQLADGGFRISQYNTAGCPPIFSYPSRTSKVCAANNELVRERLKLLKPDTVIMAARQWYDYDHRGISESDDETLIQATIADVRALGVRRIVMIGRFPVWRTPPRRILAQAYRFRTAGLIGIDAIPTRNNSYLETTAAAENERLRHFLEAKGVEFISPTPTFCNEDGCLLAVPDGSGKPVTYDGAHLISEASVYFVRERAREILGR